MLILTQEGVPHAFAKLGDLLHEVLFGNDQSLGRFAGGEGSNVGDQVAEGNVDFVTDARDDRDRAGVDRAADDFFVEGPEVFDAASPACDDDHVGGIGESFDGIDGVGDFFRRTGPLDFGRKDHDLQIAPAAVEDLKKVANGCSRGAGDDRNALGKPGEGAFVLWVE